jgi:hypothetical protein
MELGSHQYTTPKQGTTNPLNRISYMENYRQGMNYSVGLGWNNRACVKSGSID